MRFSSSLTSVYTQSKIMVANKREAYFKHHEETWMMMDFDNLIRHLLVLLSTNMRILNTPHEETWMMMDFDNLLGTFSFY